MVYDMNDDDLLSFSGLCGRFVYFSNIVWVLKHCIWSLLEYQVEILLMSHNGCSKELRTDQNENATKINVKITFHVNANANVSIDHLTSSYVLCFNIQLQRLPLACVSMFYTSHFSSNIFHEVAAMERWSRWRGTRNGFVYLASFNAYHCHTETIIVM